MKQSVFFMVILLLAIFSLSGSYAIQAVNLSVGINASINSNQTFEDLEDDDGLEELEDELEDILDEDLENEDSLEELEDEFEDILDEDLEDDDSLEELEDELEEILDDDLEDDDSLEELEDELEDILDDDLEDDDSLEELEDELEDILDDDLENEDSLKELEDEVEDLDEKRKDLVEKRSDRIEKIKKNLQENLEKINDEISEPRKEATENTLARDLKSNLGSKIKILQLKRSVLKQKILAENLIKLAESNYNYNLSSLDKYVLLFSDVAADLSRDFENYSVDELNEIFLDNKELSKTYSEEFKDGIYGKLNEEEISFLKEKISEISYDQISYLTTDIQDLIQKTKENHLKNFLGENKTEILLERFKKGEVDLEDIKTEAIESYKKMSASEKLNIANQIEKNAREEYEKKMEIAKKLREEVESVEKRKAIFKDLEYFVENNNGSKLDLTLRYFENLSESDKNLVRDDFQKRISFYKVGE